VKLLRVLETGQAMRVGGGDPVPVDVRIIAATNRQPERAVAEGKMREDLLYRLNVFPIQLPPLRERAGDIDLLADHFLDDLNRNENLAKRYRPGAHALLRSYSWPGNVRELKNVIHRAFIMADDEVDPVLPAEVVMAPAPGANASSSGSLRPGTPLAEVERRVILATLQQNGGDKRRTAEMLGISLKTLYNRLKLYSRETTQGEGDPSPEPSIIDA